MGLNRSHIMGLLVLIAASIGLAYRFLDYLASRTSLETPPWHIPSTPQEKAEYDLAHRLRIPRVMPLEAWNAMHERVALRHMPEPQPFNFWLARFKALFPHHPSVAVQYFEHLCRTEAGDYIFRKTRGVEGIFQMRPRLPASDEQIVDLYWLEDPYGFSRGDSVAAADLYTDVGKFDFFETRLAPERALASTDAAHPLAQARAPYYRYWKGASERGQSIRPVYVSGTQGIKSKYGFIWRGIRRPWDRRLGIAGGEFLIVDLKDNSVMALQRGFALRSLEYGSWATSYLCPRYRLKNTLNRASSYKLEHFFSNFVRHVLRE